MIEEIEKELLTNIIPFWRNLKDEKFGGYFGFMGTDLILNKNADKGCILNSRILWFFSNAYTLLKNREYLDEATHAYRFLKDRCLDKENGGIFWSMKYDGTVSESIKHTYNQAFAIYALSSYYEASGDAEALNTAFSIYQTIEEKCTDEFGYLEAFDANFNAIENDKLSENGVMADKTMNTLLHVLEAYTELYRVSKEQNVKEKLCRILDLFAAKIYNPVLERQEVFFDSEYNSILDLHSFGHDIETAWLLDRTVEIICENKYEKLISPITKALTKKIYETAFDGHSSAYECDRGVINEHRVWWVQAEAIVGFVNGYMKDSSKTEYLKAAESIWQFVKEYIVDKRAESEWYQEVSKEGIPFEDKPILEPWKCPYHNGRMCFEIIKRGVI